MRKSIILFAIVFAYIIGCSSSEQDKYNLLSKQDRKKVKTLCKCIEPLTPYMKKSMSAQDSSIAMMYLDSMEIKSKEIEPCIGNARLLEDKSVKDEKYTKQLIEYIREKYPDCLPFYQGVKSDSDEIK
jgi:hypothetical protein